MTIICLMAASLAHGQTPTSVDPSMIQTGPTGDIVYSTEGSFYSRPNASYSPYGSDYSPSAQAHLRARYNTKSYGQVRGNLDLGTMRVFETPEGVWFVDGQVTLNDESKIGYNVGIGYRYMTLPLFPFSDDTAKIAGISIWSDGTTTINDNFLSQFGVSLEYLGDNWDVRWNSYAALSGTESGEAVGTGDISYVGNFLAAETITGTDEALGVNEFEIARRMGNRDLWFYGGGYGLYGDTTDTTGYKLGARGYLTPDLSVDLGIYDDDVFGTNSKFTVTWFIGRTRDPAYCTPSLATRMRDPVIRNDYVAVRQDNVFGGEILEGDLDGDGEVEPIRVVHVDSSAAAGGDGSFENPLNTLAGIEGTGASPGIVFVHSGSAFTDDAAVLLDGQRMLGEGNDIEHIVSTTDFGDVVLPESSLGAASGAIPTITNSGAQDAITLANNTLEVSNLSIDGGARGIVAPNGNMGVDINHVAISNTTGNGIELTPGVFADDPETTTDELAVRFAPTISDVTFDNIGGNDIDIDATSPEASSVPITEAIAISNVTSTNGQGIGINLSNNVSAVSISDYSNDSGSGPAAILLTSNDGAVSITDATITNQAGMGISLVNSDGSHTFTDVAITDTDGAAMHVSGGEADVTFTGKITQAGLGAVLLVENEHTGSLDFFEMEEDEGVIEATSGAGIVLNNADGVYTFNENVTLNGTTNALDVTNDSEGTLTFLDAEFTDTTGTTIHFDGGEASLSLTGIVSQSNAATTLFVENEHTGTLTFTERETDEGIFDVTNGDGFVFDDADGGYVFNSLVTLDGSGNGADTAIDILNDSDGTFTFADATIVDPSGEAIRVDGGSSTFTFTGDISQNNNVAAVYVTGEHDGTMTFLSRDTDSDVITATNGSGLQFDQADGDYGFIGAVTLDGSAVAADTGVDIIDSDGTFTFSETTIVDPTGTAFNVDGGTADVDFTGSIEQSNNATTVAVTGGHTGSMTFSSIDTDTDVINATNGDGLQFDNADGTYDFDGTVVLDGSSNGADTGIDIINDSDGTFTFLDTTIVDPSGTAFNVVGGSADVSYIGNITQSNNATTVSVTGGHDGTISFTVGGDTDEVINATNGNGLQFDNADGTYRFNSAMVLNGGDAGVDILNGSSGSFTFDNEVEIINPTGDAFVIDSSSADVDFNGTITDNTGYAVRIENNTDGTVTFDGEVTSTGTGILVQNNTGGSFSFNGGADLDTTTNDAVTLASNTGTTISFSSLDINTTSGDGFVATNSEGVSVLGTGNTITTTTGTGLNLNGVEVASAGIAIDSVSVDGAVNGIVMTDVTGGPVVIGATASSQGGGGEIHNTTGDGIVLTNVEDVTLNFVEVMNATGDGIMMTNSNSAQMNVRIADSVVRGSSDQGISLDANGTGVVRLAMTDNTLDSNTNQSINLDINGNASTVHIIASDNNVDTSTTSSEAFNLVAQGASGKTVNLLLDTNSFTNDDGTAAAANILADGNATLNVTAVDNTFVNSDNTPGPAFQATTNAGSARIRLNLDGNTASSGTVAGNDDFYLINNAGTFTVEDLADIETNNTGQVSQTGVIGNDSGNIPQPQQP
ncbi:beta strand repeat-containing protein [Aeoliella mucimassa]|nr:hypothetical protein [Aeoliella mucimassa]